MHIREATELDIPEILEVLKASLGETSSQKTESVWRYKHIDNPFGKSLVLLAVKNDRIIGIRAFMRWKWQFENEIYSAFRAVDTATHPDHQGKGIFKKLTLRAIEIARENGDHFIFNTPNSQSLPGYLKMGWKEVSKIRIYLNLINPIYMLSSEKNFKYSVQSNINGDSFKELISEYNLNNSKKTELFTVKSLEYLNWRYEINPLQEYDVKTDKDFYLATYIKEQKYFNELRVVEQIFNDEIGRNKLQDALKDLQRNMKVHVISSSQNLKSSISFSGKIGPVLTFRNLNINIDINNELLDLANWNYTLGDLELF